MVEHERCAETAGNTLFPQNEGSGKAFFHRTKSETHEAVELNTRAVLEYEEGLEEALLSLLDGKSSYSFFAHTHVQLSTYLLSRGSTRRNVQNSISAHR